MSTLHELVRRSADLSFAELDHLQRLVSEWEILADLSFADLLLFVKVRDDDAFLAVAQMRPTTGQTIYAEDLVGAIVGTADRFLVDRAWREGRICREGDPEWQSGIPVRQEAIPVRYGGRVIAVVGRDSNLASARVPSQLELTYLQTAGDLARMVSDGSFPFPAAPLEFDVSPRVGDGVIRLDADGTVAYASPNALSAYRRLGVSRDLTGEHLAEVGVDDKQVYSVLESGQPGVSEIEGAGAVVLRRSLPLLQDGAVIGALVLVKDVTELRRRERQLLSKDATIREIHHRVKNNLQTVAALLRLQSRRMTMPEARAALQESIRRVSSIALVHETLSLAQHDQAEFDEIADKIIEMIGEVATAETSVRIARAGSAGPLAAEVATPLALVLAELLQNAVEHAFPNGHGLVEVRMERRAADLQVSVVDDGTGLPEGFVLEDSPRLGLQIVRTLVVGELGGSIAMRTAETGAGTAVELRVPLRGAEG